MIKLTKYSLPNDVWVRTDNNIALIYQGRSRRILQANLLIGFILDSVRLEPLTLDELVECLKKKIEGADELTNLRDSIHKLLKKLETKGLLEVQ